MATPAAIMQNVASLLNDTARQTFTDTVLIPYLNMALQDMQDIFQLNNIPVTNNVSGTLAVAAGVDRIAFANTVPILPPNLVEIRQLWESPSGRNNWTPLTKMEFLPHYLENNVQSSQFLLWAWMDQEIRLIAVNQDNDLKLDYIKSIFTVITLGRVNIDLGLVLTSAYLQYRTAALAAYFIGENEDRSIVLNNEAELAIQRSLQISTKGKQSISVRRRPYRAAFKSRSDY